MSRERSYQNEFFEAIVENTFDAIFVNDTEGNYLYVNQRAANISGYTKAELLQMNIVDLTPNSQVETVKQRIKNRIIGKEDVNIFDCNLLHKNGHLIPIEITAAIIEWEGKPAEMVSIRDITDRIKLTDNLHYLSEFQNILLQLGEDFIHFKPEKIDDVINHALQFIGEFTQVDRVYVFDYLFDEGVMNNTHEWCAKGIIPQIDNLQQIPNNTFPKWVIAHREGKTIHLPKVASLPADSALRKILEEQQIKSIITVPLLLHNKCMGFIGFDSVVKEKEWNGHEIFMLKYFANLLVNIKKRTEIENAILLAKKKAEENEQIKSAFLQSMSHELRTPLNAIIGFSSLIDAEMPMDTILEYCKIINQSGDHLLELIQNIFDLSLLMAGEMKEEKELANLYLIANDVNTTVLSERSRIGKTDVEYKWEFPEKVTIATVRVDVEKLKKILLQILSNALKFTHKGKIVFGFEIIENEKEVQFYVKDTGIGITKEKQKIIFDIFRQVDDTTTRPYGGMGIGLSLAKKLTDLLNGEIWFETEISVGTAFYVKIPLE